MAGWCPVTPNRRCMYRWSWWTTISNTLWAGSGGNAGRRSIRMVRGRAEMSRAASAKDIKNRGLNC
eukprot:3370894-Pyramimonas_sp.AAC.2